jgi:hypothetical protein
MTTIIINERTKKGRIILELVRELSCGKIVNEDSEKIPNKKTIKAIHEVSEGKTIRCEDFDDYLKKVR